MIKPGDRVVYRASPDPTVRTQYTGTVVEIRNMLATVETEGYGPGCFSAVRVDRLRLASETETARSVYGGQHTAEAGYWRTR